LDDLIERLASTRSALLPDVGPMWLAAVHAVYEAWITREPWLPLVVLEARHASTVEHVHASDLHGFVYAGAGVPRTNLAAAVAARGGVLLAQGTERATAFGTLRTAPELDPSTRHQRRVLSAWVAGGEPALLVGAVGVGRESLARAALQDVDVVRDLEELDPRQLAALLPRLEPPRVSRGGTRGQRPAQPAPGLIGMDARFCAMLDSAVSYAPTRLSLLILGETGTGKEPLARFIHDVSGRRGPFVPVDLTSRSPTLVDDDLFGHVPGAFADARTPREGALRQAHRGTLFLDELGNLPTNVQQKLLRVLEDGLVQPLGSDARHPVDLRIVAATNVDIEAMVLAGTFRADLFHRLAGAILRPPPLRERGDDVILLAEHFAAERGLHLEPGAGEALLARSFPGNIRELRGLIDAAAARGSLSPHALREVRRPLVVTTSGDLTALPRRLALRLQALQLAVAPPAERGAECLRNAVAFGLSGRPITPAALRVLGAAPWWGNFHEVNRKLSALHALPAGPIDAADIGRLFPIAVESREPIVAVLHPYRRESDGGVGGFVQTFVTGALVLGRARGRADLGARAAWIEGLAGDSSLGFLSLPHPLDLSRVQLLIRRGPRGLVLHVAPDTLLRVDVETLHDRALVVRVLRGDEPVVEAWVFLGDDWAESLAGRLEAHGRVNETLRGGAKRAWRASQAEHDLLCGFIHQLYATGRDFTPALREWLAEHPQFVELRQYLNTTNVSQSFSRFLVPSNPELRAALREIVLTKGYDAARLPALVRQAVGLE
jgi:hypothetical protein